MKLIINSNQFIIEEHCKPLVWQRILVISWSMPRQKSLILQFFSGYTRERPFPLFSLLWRSTSWTEGFFLAHWSGLQLWVSATYHQGLRCTHTVCVCVCVYVCVGVSSEQRNGLAWHPNNHYPLGPKQATLLLHYAGTQADKTNKPRVAKVPSLHVTASII